jgi:hypothetical protein
MFDDLVVDRSMKTMSGRVMQWAPKISVWHLVISRRMFDCLDRWPFLLEPRMRHGRAFDTMALAFEFAKRWGMRTCTPKTEQVAEMVKHMWSMSLNYGPLQNDQNGAYAAKLATLEAEYDRRFPDGIDGLWAKIGR